MRSLLLFFSVLIISCKSSMPIQKSLEVVNLNVRILEIDSNFNEFLLIRGVCVDNHDTISIVSYNKNPFLGRTTIKNKEVINVGKEYRIKVIELRSRISGGGFSNIGHIVIGSDTLERGNFNQKGILINIQNEEVIYYKAFNLEGLSLLDI